MTLIHIAMSSMILIHNSNKQHDTNTHCNEQYDTNTH